MYKSYLLPLSSLRGFAQAEVFDVQKGSKHQLLVQRDRPPNFQFNFLNKYGGIIVYIKKGNQCLNDDFDNFIKVGVCQTSDLAYLDLPFQCQHCAWRYSALLRLRCRREG